MKKLLLLFIFSMTLFTGCSDDKDSKTEDKTTYWKVIRRQKLTFVVEDDGVTSSGTGYGTPVDSLFLKIQGNDITAYTVTSDSTYTATVTSTTMGDGPVFGIKNSDVMDSEFSSGNSDYSSFSGQIPFHIQGISFMFYKTATSGDMGTIEFESIETELPSENWTLSDTDLFVDWKTFFKF